MSDSSNQIACPGCGTMSAGKYCPECGAALVGAKCNSCKSFLTPGALFCHRCAAPVASRGGGAKGAATHAAPAAAAPRSILPWVVAGGALLAVVIMIANQQSKVTPTEGAAPFAMGGGGGGAVRAPDISQMSPRERADRLYNRVMTMAAEGKADSAAFFASMAVGAYESLTPLDLDLRYDYGRMAEMAGDFTIAGAQADSILQEQPDHMLGIILRARVTMARGDSTAGRKELARLSAVEKTERAKALEEYDRHRGDIDAALALVRR